MKPPSPPPTPLNLSNLPKASSFTMTLQNLQTQLPAILDDFTNDYVLYNTTPTDTQYQNAYSNIKSNLNNINTQLFSLMNSVESNTDKITNNLVLLDKSIQFYKIQNNILKQKLKNVKEMNNSSDELIYNYKQMYDANYLKNWGLGLSIGTGFLFLFIIFQSKQSSTTGVPPPPVPR